ncbi:hypothetical protein CKO38_15350 [Rhodospirillum rubrum]|uniref:YciE/YciF ferroxidase family protein n=1 Tax=Rhodospirillum rubrum TaxID=1085 RepID=UPI001907A7DE|nr:ferritin-like domain-containing protein [Rhodospirillum rubrum]MBK1665357.1 hypothetical protein [Rhodospirillum rubrum]MBK1678023.1 hypothetical protein [Rhodospirillum rubrum]
MGRFIKDIGSLDDLFVHALEDIYYAEQKILTALPKMIEKATDSELREGFETHLHETQKQVERLEQVFANHGVEPKAAKCAAIDGIIDEAEDLAGEIRDTEVLDAALISAAQAVEHYEITRYGTLVAWAKRLGVDECAQLLEETLAEEKATDEKLSALAYSSINLRAAE